MAGSRPKKLRLIYELPVALCRDEELRLIGGERNAVKRT